MDIFSNTFLIISSTVFILLYLYFTRHFNYWKKRNVPYFKPTPFLGSFWKGLSMQLCMGEALQDLHNRIKAPFVGFFIVDKPFLLLRDPNIIKQFLNTDFRSFYDRTGTVNLEIDPIGYHIMFMLKNPEWKETRAKMSPIFTSSKIKAMSQLISKTCDDLQDYLGKLKEKNSEIEVKDALQRYMVETISSTIFGIESGCYNDPAPNIVDWAKKLFDWNSTWWSFQMRASFIFPSVVHLLKLKLLNPYSISNLKNLFETIMAQRKLSKMARNDMIDILLELEKQDSSFFKGNILVAQAIMFFAAGYETSSGAMSFALYEFAHNRSIQTKVRLEIKNVLEKQGKLTYESLKSLTYLDKCIKETLRKYPILPFLDRVCNQTYKIPNTDVVIDKNVGVYISLLGLHYDPENFPNPHVFDPDRFTDEKNAMDNFVYMPFGAGPRFCVGERFGLFAVKMGLAKILEKFEVSVCDKTPKTIRFDKNGVTLSPANGLTLRFERIEE